MKTTDGLLVLQAMTTIPSGEDVFVEEDEHAAVLLCRSDLAAYTSLRTQLPLLRHLQPGPSSPSWMAGVSPMIAVQHLWNRFADSVPDRRRMLRVFALPKDLFRRMVHEIIQGRDDTDPVMALMYTVMKLWDHDEDAARTFLGTDMHEMASILARNCFRVGLPASLDFMYISVLASLLPHTCCQEDSNVQVTLTGDISVCPLDPYLFRSPLIGVAMRTIEKGQQVRCVAF